jgi:hypothetical protein
VLTGNYIPIFDNSFLSPCSGESKKNKLPGQQVATRSLFGFVRLKTGTVRSLTVP